MNVGPASQKENVKPPETSLAWNWNHSMYAVVYVLRVAGTGNMQHVIMLGKAQENPS